MDKLKNLKSLLESPVGIAGRTSLQDAMMHITPELEKKFEKIVKEIGGKTVARILLDRISAFNAIDKLEGRDSDLKKYQTKNQIDAKKNLKESTENPEDDLIKHNIKIKQKFSTKFGIQFDLAKKYPENDIKTALKNFKYKIDGESIFVYL